MWQARVGIEARACAVENIVCGAVGADLALSHVNYISDEDASDSMDTVALVVLPRVSVELGSKHVRLRGTFEFGAGTEGIEAGLSAGLVALW